MPKFIAILISVIAFGASSVKAATIPSDRDSLLSINASSLNISELAFMKVKDIEKITGKKLDLKERIAFKVFQWKLKNKFAHEKDDKTDKGKTAMILGIIGISSFWIPYVGIASIPCTVLALVFGYQAKKINPDDSKAKTAIVLGWITVGLYVLITALVIAILATWSWA